MNDDFNTPEAVAVLFELAGEVNRSGSAETAALLKALGATLGLLQQAPRAFLQAGSGARRGGDRRAHRRARRRQEGARLRRADRIRDELAGAGHRAQGLGRRARPG